MRRTCSNLCVKAWAIVWFFAAKQSLLNRAKPEDICRQPQVHPKRNSTEGTTVGARNSQLSLHSSFTVLEYLTVMNYTSKVSGQKTVLQEMHLVGSKIQKISSDFTTRSQTPHHKAQRFLFRDVLN